MPKKPGFVRAFFYASHAEKRPTVSFLTPPYATKIHAIPLLLAQDSLEPSSMDD